MQIQGKDMDQNARPRQTAPGIRSTVSYIIFLDHVLGQGATSKVYLGRHKKSGKRVACKVPHPDHPFRGSADMERESRVLLHLKHPNILCLEAIENDQISKERILFMELCAAGSLYDMLEKPQHAKGLQEEVFLQVLNDITCGMKYLRDKGLVHRDVKPGNIMCFTDERGRAIYKLADFGAARELADEENFTSLYGTEEYLHPGMFEKAVLKTKSDQHFDARVDLWSIGITLYHLATGLLPFRPQGGRKNSSMMHYLTTEKAPGVISGVQTGPGRDDVVWSSELPETCQLSVGLKNLLTPLLASLLELDPAKLWSFTQFFEASQSILSRKQLHILWIDHASNLRVYSNAADTFAEVQEAVTTQTQLPAGEQIFFINGDVYHSDRKCTANDLPQTSRGKPIMLCRKGRVAEPSQISPPHVATMPVLHPRYSTQNDYPIAKGAVAAAYVLQRRQEQLHEMSGHFDSFVEAVRSNLLTDSLRLQADSASLRSKLDTSLLDIQLSTRALDALAQSSDKNVAAKAQMLRLELNGWKPVLGEHEQRWRDVAVSLHSLLSDLQRPDGLRALWKPSQGCSVSEDACNLELVHVTSEMEEILQRFAKDKKLGKLSYNEEQIHKMEKLNLGEKMKQTKACMVKCEQRWRNQHALLMKWNDKASSQRQQIQAVHAKLSALIGTCQGIKRTITELSTQSWHLIGSASGYLQAATRDPAHVNQLENSTQTSLHPSHLHQPSWSGIGHLTDSRQPLTMGPGRTDPSSVVMSPWQSQEPPSRWVASAPSTGALYAAGLEQSSAFSRKSSPPVLDAHGHRSPTMIPDLPLELSGGPQRKCSGDNSSARGAGEVSAGAQGGSRMIQLPKSLKHSLEKYQKQSGNTPFLIQESNKIMNAMHDLSLTVEMPDLDSIPITLTQEVEGELQDNSDEEFGSLVIKRPPASYQSVVE